MSWVWWSVIEVSLGLAAAAVELQFRVYRRVAAMARQLRSEKARVGLRTGLYTAVATVGLLVVGLENITKSEAPVTGALVWIGFHLVVSFVVAMIQTSSEERPATASKRGAEASS